MQRAKCLLLITGLALLAACAGKRPDYVLLIEHRSGDLRQLYRVMPNEAQAQLLMEIPVRDPYWISPKGSYVAVVHRDGATQTSLMTLYDLATGETLNSLEDVGQYDFEEIPYTENVVWAADEQSIVFLRPSSERNGTDLWLYDIDTASVRPLTDDEAVERAPSWSRDGSQLAYASLPTCHESAWDCPSEESFWQVKVLSVEDGELRVVTDKPQTAEFQGNVVVQQRSLCNLAWSPNSEYLLFEDGCRPIGPSTYKELYVVNVDTGDLAKLTDFSNGSLIRYAASWTADTEHIHIAYAEAPFGPNDPETTLATSVVVIETERFSIQGEFALSGNDALPEMTWSSDGTLLAGFPFNGETIIAELDNADLVVDPSLQLPLGSCFPPQWSPTGDYLAYVTTPDSRDPCPSEGNYTLTIVKMTGEVVSGQIDVLEGYNQIIGWYPNP